MNIHYEYNITCIEKGKWVYKTEIWQECWHTKENVGIQKRLKIIDDTNGFSNAVLLYP